MVEVKSLDQHETTADAEHDGAHHGVENGVDEGEQGVPPPILPSHTSSRLALLECCTIASVDVVFTINV